MIGYQGDKGYTVPFSLVESDGISPYQLAGKTVKWSFKARDDSIPTGSPLTGIIISETQGQVDFVIPEEILANIKKFKSQITPEEGVIIGASSEPFIFAVDETTKDTS